MGTIPVMHARPRAPEAGMTRTAALLQPFSVTTISTSTAIRNPTVMLSRYPPSPEDSSQCIGTASTSEAAAPTTLPMAAHLTAVIPLPLSRSRWPGRTLSTESGSGTPRNTDGTKSVAECTTAAESTQALSSSGASSAGANDEMTSVSGPLNAMSISARVFTWIPGTSPVNVPIPAPMTHM